MCHLKRLKYSCILRNSAVHHYQIILNIHNIVAKTWFIQLTYNVRHAKIHVRISIAILEQLCLNCYVNTLNCIISILPGNRLECVRVFCLLEACPLEDSSARPWGCARPQQVARASAGPWTLSTRGVNRRRQIGSSVSLDAGFGLHLRQQKPSRMGIELL